MRHARVILNEEALAEVAGPFPLDRPVGVVYKRQVLELRQTDTFRQWRVRLRDGRARSLIASRLDRLAYGHAGDARGVGDGVFELRIHYGPGYRVYFAQRDDRVILLLCGGDKGSQTRDITRAKRLLAEME
jgi:putative addiction module killer protein